MSSEPPVAIRGTSVKWCFALSVFKIVKPTLYTKKLNVFTLSLYWMGALSWDWVLCHRPPHCLALPFSGHTVSDALHGWEQASSALAGRRPVKSGAPCCWSHPPADEGEMEAEFDHSSLATSVTATERGKTPPPRQRSSKQAGPSAFAWHAASL